MANPTVEKLKETGLRYGDKAAMGLTSLLFVICFIVALSKKSIDITPDEVKSAAQASDTNLNKPQERDSIIKKLEDGGIKLTNFSKEVQDASKSLLVADNYKPDREYVTPEPGAGLIRDTPDLIAPNELYAYPGRGGALVFELDENGNRIPDTEKKDQPKEEPKRRRRRRAAGGMGGGYGGMMGAMSGVRKKRANRQSQADIAKEQQQEYEQKKRATAAKLAGRDEAPEAKDEQAKTETPETTKQEQYKETTKGLRWVAITGVLDHGKLVANYRKALKNPAVAYPHYARLDLQRQVQQKDGSWSDWEKVDAEENLKVLDNLPEEDDELTLDNVRPDNLNDPLPFLRAGLWEKVHIASLVPQEKKKVEPPPPPMGEGGGMRGMMMGGGMGGGYAAMMARGGMGGYGGMGGGYGGMGGGYAAMMARGGMGGMSGYGGMGGAGYGAMMRMGGGSMGGMGMGAGAGTELSNFWKSEEKRVMIRALDFTPLPDNSYRYRVRIVVFNPNHGHDDVSPGVDTKSTELSGPWSEATDEVSMPADVAAYAMGVMPRDPKADLKVNFEVIRFDPSDGVTVPRRFAAGPGEVIGDVSTADIPTSEGTGKKSKPIDFNTHQIVLDTAGGIQPLPSQFVGGALERPALALLLRPDGSVLARGQPDDVSNEVRKDIERNYAREIKESNKKRENSMGSGYGSMGYGGMMGGGMGYGGMMGGPGGKR
jgi:hypothetical protein